MTSDDDYYTRIKSYFNCQRHITLKVKIDVWSCSEEKTINKQEVNVTTVNFQTVKISTLKYHC